MRGSSAETSRSNRDSPAILALGPVSGALLELIARDVRVNRGTFIIE
jgi:hypothetical protein